MTSLLGNDICSRRPVVKHDWKHKLQVKQFLYHFNEGSVGAMFYKTKSSALCEVSYSPVVHTSFFKYFYHQPRTYLLYLLLMHSFSEYL